MNESRSSDSSASDLPEAVERALLRILSQTLLCIRGLSNKPELCFAFSDHAHNIPGLIANYSDDAFCYYWEVERPIFNRTIRELQFTFNLFDDHWSFLEKHYSSLK